MNNILSPQGMKLLKVFHLIFIMMWTIGVVMMSILNWKSEALLPKFVYNQEMSLLIDYIFVIPGAICAVITGIIYGFKTNWGFFKYKWITVKWILGILVIIIGTFVLHPIALDIVSNTESLPEENYKIFLNDWRPDIVTLQIMATIQAVALIFLIVVSVYKPWMKKKNKNIDKKII